MKKIKRIIRLALPAVLLLLWISAAGETAEKVTYACSFTSSSRERDENFLTNLVDGNLGTYFTIRNKKEEAYLEIRSEEPVFGVYVMLSDRERKDRYELMAEDGSGGWKKIGESRYLTNWHPLEEAQTALRIRAADGGKLRIAEIVLYGEGEKPEEVQDWQEGGKADLMLLACHPDDEVLWFAGVMPVYAEKGWRVQLAMMTSPNGERQLELLNSAWHCGMRNYPCFIGLEDRNGQKKMDRQYALWEGEDRVHRLVTECFRKYRPEVVVTHGEKGEYGHSGHQVTADSAKKCIGYAADSGKYPESAEKYGAWQVKKLYLHQYEENQVTMDWGQPLDSFGGKTGFDIAGEAFQCHRSQVKIGHYTFQQGGKYDNTAFGLYFSAVGEDSGKNDFMENIRQSSPDD